MSKFLVKKADGKDPVVKEDGRKKPVSNRAKHLKYMRIKPLICDDCPYRSQESGGNGVCTEYKEGSVCTIRKDLGKIAQELDTRDPDLLKARVDLMTTSLAEEVEFHLKMTKAGNLPPNKDLIAAYKATLDGMKIMGELQRKDITKEITETQTLSNDQITQISRTIREQRSETTD